MRDQVEREHAVEFSRFVFCPSFPPPLLLLIFLNIFAQTAQGAQDRLRHAHVRSVTGRESSLWPPPRLCTRLAQRWSDKQCSIHLKNKDNTIHTEHEPEAARSVGVKVPAVGHVQSGEKVPKAPSVRIAGAEMGTS